MPESKATCPLELMVQTAKGLVYGPTQRVSDSLMLVGRVEASSM